MELQGLASKYKNPPVMVKACGERTSTGAHTVAPTPETEWPSMFLAPPSKVTSYGHHLSAQLGMGLDVVEISPPLETLRAAVSLAV